MSQAPCQTCSAVIADGATFCARCAHQLDEALQDIARPRGLAHDLDIALTRQNRFSTRDGSRPTEAAVPHDGRASQAASDLTKTLRKWAYVVKNETGAGYPPRQLAALAAWLRPRIGWLRHHVDGGRAHGEILDAVAYARKVIDRPAERLYAGPCDCGEDLYARLDADYVICHGVGHEEPVAWEVEARRRWLLDSAQDVIATANDISRALTRYAQPVTPSAIRGYVFRRRLRPVWCTDPENVDRGGAALYRLGDVLAIVAPEPEKVSA